MEYRRKKKEKEIQYNATVFALIRFMYFSVAAVKRILLSSLFFYNEYRTGEIEMHRSSWILVYLLVLVLQRQGYSF